MASNHYGSSWNPKRSQPTPPPHNGKAKKVVSIPVHFVDSTTRSSPGTLRARAAARTAESRVAAVATLQRAARGWLARKSVRAVRSVAAEVEEIEKRIEARIAELRVEERERTIFGEMLMALLLKLDAVRGARDYRKKVIKRIIGLQEALDNLAAPEKKEESGEAKRNEEGGEDEKAQDEDELSANIAEGLDLGNVPVEKDVEQLAPGADSHVTEPMEQDVPASSAEEVVDEDLIQTAKPMASEEWELVDDSSNSGDESAQDIDLESDLKEETPIAEQGKQAEQNESEGTNNLAEGSTEMGMIVEESGRSGETFFPKIESNISTPNIVPADAARESMERMASQVQNMERLLADLCDRQAQEWQLMASLMDRVGHLERAVLKMERQNKRHRADGRAAGFPKKTSKGFTKDQ